MTGMGQTQTAGGSSAADLEAMSAPTERLPELCRQGNATACRLLQTLRPDDPAAAAARAAERDRQADQERLAISGRAAESGLNPGLVQAIRTGRDVQYVARNLVAGGDATLLASLKSRLSAMRAAAPASRPGVAWALAGVGLVVAAGCLWRARRGRSG